MSDKRAPKKEKSLQSIPDRRRLVKTLAVGGVITATQVVPHKWAKPVVKVAGMPAHAMVSGCLIVDSCGSYTWDGNNFSFFLQVTVQTGGPINEQGASCTLSIGGNMINEFPLFLQQGPNSFICQWSFGNGLPGTGDVVVEVDTDRYGSCEALTVGNISGSIVTDVTLGDGFCRGLGRLSKASAQQGTASKKRRRRRNSNN